MGCTAAHRRSRSLNIVSLSDTIEGSYRSWDFYTTGQLVDGLQQKRKPVFIKWKWNHVVFSRETILSFHPVILSFYKKKKLFQTLFKKHSIATSPRGLQPFKNKIYCEHYWFVKQYELTWRGQIKRWNRGWVIGFYDASSSCRFVNR